MILQLQILENRRSVQFSSWVSLWHSSSSANTISPESWTAIKWLKLLYGVSKLLLEKGSNRLLWMNSVHWTNCVVDLNGATSSSTAVSSNAPYVWIVMASLNDRHWRFASINIRIRAIFVRSLNRSPDCPHGSIWSESRTSRTLFNWQNNHWRSHSIE